MPTAPQSVLCLGLHAPEATDPGATGAKAAALARLVAAGFAVPDGLVLTTAAFAEAQQTRTQGRARTEGSARMEGNAPDRTVRPPTEPAGELPAEVAAAVEAIAEHFAGHTVAVRSSAVEEDGATASFAGQFVTVLHVRGADALLAAIREVWASASGELAAAYRGGAAAPGGGVPMAVLVQRQVAADVAGVAFTADPVTGDRGTVRVAAVPGLADGLVAGAVDPDEWLVRSGAASPLRARHQALTESQAVAVADLVRRIEQLCGVPQDVEWAMADGRLVVLQARPITALPSPPSVELPEGTWIKESERHPEPLTELGASCIGRIVGGGLTTMARESGGLVDRFEARAIGGEPYLRVVPLGGRGGPPPPWWLLGILTRVAPPLRRQMRRAKALLRPGVLEARIQQWEQQWRPEIQERISGLQAVDLAALDDTSLGEHLDRAVTTLEHCLDVHFRLTVPYLVRIHALIVEGERLGWPELRTTELLAGLSTATSAPSRALATLAERVRADRSAAAALDGPADDLPEALHRADPALGTAFDEWCARYGRCCVNDDPGSPVLAELPWALAALLRDAVRPDAEQAETRTAQVRAERAAEARAALATRPQADRDRFEQVLAAALRAYPVREDSAFWTASLPAGLVRTAALEFGRRLVARGVLDRADDAVCLTLDALRTSLEQAGKDADALRAAVLRARSERAYVRTHPGPPYHGPAPQPFPDLRGLPRGGRQINEAMLFMQRRRAVGQVAAAGDDSTGSLAGVPASPGVYTGPVRVIRGPADFGRLRAGDVLVCPTTDPAWSLLFGVAGALVTDGGNVLSHAAIVAREHAIPAVVGTEEASRTLRDGQVVTVDGTAGQVRLAEARAERPAAAST